MPSQIASRTSLNRFNRVVYNTIFKRNSVFVTTVLFSAFAFQLSFDRVVDGWYHQRNKGKHFEDIIGKFAQ
ncbi:qcr9 subunit 9 of the ubiquinol cytochrome-c reductase complex [Dimargaris verticillata]|uniref:Complex III subunit 9 n=1 Tax=Dimargaris verticillata TaxID=2761393 RepID=A0A9W8AXI1_9FUNG|nr:qcr9 subunit 9 of the ubiquinol cytochrome-c reductase complex [Dimargaris verticillata]